MPASDSRPLSHSHSTPLIPIKRTVAISHRGAMPTSPSSCRCHKAKSIGSTCCQTQPISKLYIRPCPEGTKVCENTLSSGASVTRAVTLHEKRTLSRSFLRHKCGVQECTLLTNQHLHTPPPVQHLGATMAKAHPHSCSCPFPFIEPSGWLDQRYTDQ